MAKRLSEKNKEEIIKLFIDGKTIENLAIEFNCTKLTISRNLKKEIGEKKFKELNKSAKPVNLVSNNKQKTPYTTDKEVPKKNIYKRKSENKQTYSKDENKEFQEMSEFMEITPLDYEIDNAVQKDLSSVPISEIDFPLYCTSSVSLLYLLPLQTSQVT